MTRLIPKETLKIAATIFESKKVKDKSLSIRILILADRPVSKSGNKLTTQGSRGSQMAAAVVLPIHAITPIDCHGPMKVVISSWWPETRNQKPQDKSHG
jgi:hypothetical protein